MAYSIAVDVSAIVDGQNIDAADVTTPIANLKTAVQDLGNGVSAPEQFRLAEITTPSNPAAASYRYYVNSTDHKLHKLTPAGVDTVVEVPTTYPTALQGRLTLTTGLAVTTADVTAATTVYYTPYGGNRIDLYNGSTWDTYGLTQISASLAGLTASTPYDVYIYYSAGLTLELVAWMNDTTRATALALQDGVYCKTGTLTKRYVGTIRTTSTIGQTEDSLLNRLVWNMYNRVSRELYIQDTTDSWAYTTATWRSWNNSAANRVGIVTGVAEDVAWLNFTGHVSTTTTFGALGVGLNSTTAPTRVFVKPGGATSIICSGTALYSGVLAAGYNYLQLLEIGSTGNTFYGDGGLTTFQSGAVGTVKA